MIVPFRKLQALSGLTRPGSVCRWLQSRGVAYIRGSNGEPFTTLAALNRTLDRQRATDEPEYGVRDCTPAQWLREEAALCDDDDGRLAFWLREAADQIDALSVDAARYRWLRDGNGYAPEEGFARGGADLDRLCDEGIRDAKERT